MEFLRKVRLPGAKLYDQDSPLAKEIEIRNLTVAEEKLFLTNPGTIAFDKVLQKCVTSEPLDLKEMFISDKAYLLFQVRALTYGEEFGSTLKCECGFSGRVESNISDLPENRIEDLDEYDKLREITLPVSKDVVLLKLPSGYDSEEVEKRLNRFRQSKMIVDSGTEYVYNLATCIESINGEEKTLVERATYFDAMHAKDAAYLRKKIEKIKLGYELKAEVECPNCGRIQSAEVNLDTEFFRPYIDD